MAGWAAGTRLGSGLAFVVAALLLGPRAFAGAQVLDHVVKDIDGNEVDLGRFQGRVVLIVNVASLSGLTFQYEDLVTLYGQYKDQGFTILAFPANNFNGQEPGTDAEIKAFSTKKFNVTFPMFAKISVKGEDQAPLYEELTSEEKNGAFGGEIVWNFTKFLVNREGRVVGRFEPRVKPTSPEIRARIEAELRTEP